MHTACVAKTIRNQEATRSPRPQLQKSIHPRPPSPARQEPHWRSFTLALPQPSTAICIGSTPSFIWLSIVQGATCLPTRQPTCSTVHQTQQSLRQRSSGRTPHPQWRPSSLTSRQTWVWTWTTTTSVRSMATTTTTPTSTQKRWQNIAKAPRYLQTMEIFRPNSTFLKLEIPKKVSSFFGSL